MSLADSPLARLHGNYDRRRSWKAILITVAIVALVGTAIAARVTMTLIPPHAVVPEPGVLGSDAVAQLAEYIDYDRPRDRQQAIDFALDYTARALSPSPSHPTSLDFGTKKRGGNSSEYAALFVTVFEAAAKQAQSTARAWRVRSSMRLFGKPFVASHEWIMVRDPADGACIYLDPMLYDAWASSDLSVNVKGGGQIEIPGEAGK